MSRAKQTRDFDAYRRFYIEGGSSCSPPPELVAIGQSDPVKVFVAFDGQGTRPTECSDPKGLQEALAGKEGLNFHISDLWSASVRDKIMFNPFVAWESLRELAADMPYLPAWAWRATWAQACKGTHVDASGFDNLCERFPLIQGVFE